MSRMQDLTCSGKTVRAGNSSSGSAAASRHEGFRQNVGVHPWWSMLAGKRNRLIIRGHPARRPAIDEARWIQQRSDKTFMIAGRENFHLCKAMSILGPSRERSALQVNADLVER